MPISCGSDVERQRERQKRGEAKRDWKSERQHKIILDPAQNGSPDSEEAEQKEAEGEWSAQEETSQKTPGTSQSSDVLPSQRNWERFSTITHQVSQEPKNGCPERVSSNHFLSPQSAKSRSWHQPSGDTFPDPLPSSHAQLPIPTPRVTRGGQR